MPAQEVQQPQSQQMELPSQDASRVSSEQPRQTEQMTAEPVSMRGGGEGGDICCGRKPPSFVLHSRNPSTALVALQSNSTALPLLHGSIANMLQSALVSPASNASSAAAKRLRLSEDGLDVYPGETQSFFVRRGSAILGLDLISDALIMETQHYRKDLAAMR